MTLSKEIFKKGIAEIEEVFDEFKMNDKKAKIWYEYSKDLTINKFLYRIKNCIKGCRKVPTLADIIDWKNYYVNEKEEADLRAKEDELRWEKQKEEEGDFKRHSIPPEIKEHIKQIKLKSLGKE